MVQEIDYKQRLLEQAIDKGNNKKLLEAIAAGADVNKYETFAPLHTASMRGEPRILKTLIEAGADVNKRLESNKSSIGDTPLLKLTRHAPYEFHKSVNLLLESGADPNLSDCNGNTPLHLCCMGPTDDSLKVINLLLESGADPALLNHKSQTPNDLASSYYHRSGSYHPKKDAEIYETHPALIQLRNAEEKQILQKEVPELLPACSIRIGRGRL